MHHIINTYQQTNSAEEAIIRGPYSNTVFFISQFNDVLAIDRLTLISLRLLLLGIVSVFFWVFDS